MPTLYPDDQRKVDEVLNSNVNRVERAPFKPLVLLGALFAVLVVFTGLAFAIAARHGVL